MFGFENIPHTSLNICQDILGLLIALAFGLYAYARQIGGWGNVGIFVMAVIGINLCPDNEGVVAFIIGGAVAGTFVGMFTVTPVGFQQRPFRSASGSRFPGGLGDRVAGFEDVEDASDETLFGAAGSQEQDGANQAPPPAKDYYATLGVDRAASEDDLKRAYRRLLKTCHPDLFPGDKEKESLAKEINEAYDVLSDAQKRAAYDRFGFV